MERIITINEYQKTYYEDVDYRNSRQMLKRYLRLIDLKKFGKNISILDVGGGSGYFSKAVYDELTPRGITHAYM